MTATEPRLEMLTAEEAVRAAEQAQIPVAFADLNVFRILLRNPKTAKAISDLLLSQLFGGALDDRLRELVIMRVGWATGSDYEWTQHWPLAQKNWGCTAEELLAVRDWPRSELFGQAEQAVLRSVDETLEGGAISAAVFAECRAHLDQAACLELVTAIGTWRLISQVARSIMIPLEQGVASWPPDGVASPADHDS